MQDREEPRVEDAIYEIAAMLAAAYERRSRLRLVRPEPEAVPSTEELANDGELSVHELMLTRQTREPRHQ
jgi:hypothetical protein